MSEAAAKPPRMTVDEFVAWSEDQPGRHELYDGQVFTMQSERMAHVLVKGGIYRAFDAAVRRGGERCMALMDGVTVKIDDRTAFVPDCTIHCGDIELRSVFATNPVVVVEVLSPSSQAVDITRKFPQYFRVPAIVHYLIVDPDKRIVVHHQRDGEKIASRILHGGEIVLDPPGITVAVGEFFADLPPEEPEHT